MNVFEAESYFRASAAQGDQALACNVLVAALLFPSNVQRWLTISSVGMRVRSNPTASTSAYDTPPGTRVPGYPVKEDLGRGRPRCSDCQTARVLQDVAEAKTRVRALVLP